ncbi:MAG: argininosuccinate synthase [Methanobacteriota archaeon]|nr:MAG: argininosuccinate synthase [Euryarchaeota archaeon]
MSRNKVVLAYSGGLDTSVAIRWLQDRSFDVVALTVDVGQPGDLAGIKEKAERLGAKAYVLDVRREFAEEFILPALKANAMYEGQYPLSTAVARPLIGKHLVAVARREGAKFVAHGCTGKGNDQVRFDLCTTALAPELQVIAPARVWNMTREQEIAYAKEHGIPVPVENGSPYSTDENLWGRSIECGVLEDPRIEPPEEVFEWTSSPMAAPEEPAYTTIRFEAGKPVAMDGKREDFASIIVSLNELAGRHGVGRIDHVESRVVGIKSREVYECPAATVLMKAHQALEALVLPRDVLEFARTIASRYATLIYDGLWFTPLREAFDAFIESTQTRVSGDVSVKLYKGSANVVGRASPNSMYDHGLATYSKGDQFRQDMAEGFIYVWGLPARTWAAVGEKSAPAKLVKTAKRAK